LRISQIVPGWPRGTLDDCIEHWLGVRRRAPNDAQNLARGYLLLKCILELTGPPFELVLQIGIGTTPVGDWRALRLIALWRRPFAGCLLSPPRGMSPPVLGSRRCVILRKSSSSRHGRMSSMRQSDTLRCGNDVRFKPRKQTFRLENVR